MNIFKTFLLFILSSYSVGVGASDASTLFGEDKITNNLRNGGEDLVLTADNILGFIIGLLYFIAICVTIYGGFLILTSGGEDERLKKWKNYFIYAVVWLIVIFLASQLILWVIGIMSDPEIVW